MAETVSDMVLIVNDDDPKSPFPGPFIHHIGSSESSGCQEMDDRPHGNRKVERANKLFETAQSFYEQNKFTPCLRLVSHSLAIHPTMAARQLQQAAEMGIKSLSTGSESPSSAIKKSRSLSYNMSTYGSPPSTKHTSRQCSKLHHEQLSILNSTSPVDSNNNKLPLASNAKPVKQKKKPMRLKRSESVTSRTHRKPARLTRSRSLQTPGMEPRINWPRKGSPQEFDAIVERKRLRQCAHTAAPFEFDAVRGALEEDDQVSTQQSCDSFFTLSTIGSSSTVTVSGSSGGSRMTRRTASLDRFDSEFDLSPDNPNVHIRKLQRDAIRPDDMIGSSATPVRYHSLSTSKSHASISDHSSIRRQQQRARRSSTPAGLLSPLPPNLPARKSPVYRSMEFLPLANGDVAKHSNLEISDGTEGVDEFHHPILDEDARMDAWDHSPFAEQHGALTPLPNAKLNFDAPVSETRECSYSEITQPASSTYRQRRFRANLEAAKPMRKPMSNRFRRCKSEITPKHTKDILGSHDGNSDDSGRLPTFNMLPVNLGTHVVNSSTPPCFATPTREELIISSSNMSVDAQIGACVGANIKIVTIDFDQTLVKVHTSGRWNNHPRDLCQHIRPVFRCLIPALVEAGVFVAIATFSPQNKLIRNVLSIAFPDLELDKHIFVKCSSSPLNSPIDEEEEVDNKENVDSNTKPPQPKASSQSWGSGFLARVNRSLSSRRPFGPRQATVSPPKALSGLPRIEDMEVASPDFSLAKTNSVSQLDSLEESSWTPEASGKRLHIACIIKMCQNVDPSLSVTPAQILLIDDDKNNVAIAKQDGYRTIRFMANEGSITAEDHLLRSLSGFSSSVLENISA